MHFTFMSIQLLPFVELGFAQVTLEDFSQMSMDVFHVACQLVGLKEWSATLFTTTCFLLGLFVIMIHSQMLQKHSAIGEKARAFKTLESIASFSQVFSVTMQGKFQFGPEPFLAHFTH